MWAFQHGNQVPYPGPRRAPLLRSLGWLRKAEAFMYPLEDGSGRERIFGNRSLALRWPRWHYCDSQFGTIAVPYVPFADVFH